VTIFISHCTLFKTRPIALTMALYPLVVLAIVFYLHNFKKIYVVDDNNNNDDDDDDDDEIK